MAAWRFTESSPRSTKSSTRRSEKPLLLVLNCRGALPDAIVDDIIDLVDVHHINTEKDNRSTGDGNPTEFSIENSFIIVTRNLSLLPSSVRNQLKQNQLVLCVGGCNIYKSDDIALAQYLNLNVIHIDVNRHDEVADTVLALILNYSRKIAQLRQYGCAYKSWLPTGGMRSPWEGFRRLRGQTLGLVGANPSGQGVAKRAVAFGMNVLYFTNSSMSEEDERGESEMHGAKRVACLDSLLSASDIVSLHCTMAANSEPIINSESIAHIKPGSMLINTCESEVMENNAVKIALSQGLLGAFALDGAQPPTWMEAWVREIPNVVILPRSADQSEEAWFEAQEKLVEVIRRFLETGKVALEEDQIADEDEISLSLDGDGSFCLDAGGDVDEQADDVLKGAGEEAVQETVDEDLVPEALSVSMADILSDNQQSKAGSDADSQAPVDSQVLPGNSAITSELLPPVAMNLNSSLVEEKQDDSLGLEVELQGNGFPAAASIDTERKAEEDHSMEEVTSSPPPADPAATMEQSAMAPAAVNPAAAPVAVLDPDPGTLTFSALPSVSSHDVHSESLLSESMEQEMKQRDGRQQLSRRHLTEPMSMPYVNFGSDDPSIHSRGFNFPLSMGGQSSGSGPLPGSETPTGSVAEEPESPRSPPPSDAWSMPLNSSNKTVVHGGFSAMSPGYKTTESKSGNSVVKRARSIGGLFSTVFGSRNKSVGRRTGEDTADLMSSLDKQQGHGLRSSPRTFQTFEEGELVHLCPYIGHGYYAASKTESGNWKLVVTEFMRPAESASMFVVIRDRDRIGFRSVAAENAVVQAHGRYEYHLVMKSAIGSQESWMQCKDYFTNVKYKAAKLHVTGINKKVVS